MKRTLLTLLALCTLAAAMVPRPRRAVNTEDEIETSSSASAQPVTQKICAFNTPCAWSVYEKTSKIIEQHVLNTYCNCEEGLLCLVNEEDLSAYTYTHRCRSPADSSIISIL